MTAALILHIEAMMILHQKLKETKQQPEQPFAVALFPFILNPV